MVYLPKRMHYFEFFCLIFFCIFRITVQSPPKCVSRRIYYSDDETAYRLSIDCSDIGRYDLAHLFPKTTDGNDTLNKNRVITIRIFGHGQHVPAGVFDAYQNVEAMVIGSDRRQSPDKQQLQQQCTIHSRSFENLRSLTSLELQNCDLGSNNFAPLAPLTLQLNSLHLRGCSVEPYPFILKQITNLTNLVIAYGHMKSISIDTFKKSAITLKVLGLTGNDLRRVPYDAFRGMKLLKSLYLAKNNITEISAGAFDDLIKLEILHLGQNRIAEFPDDLFNNTLELTDFMYMRNAAFIGRSDLAHLTKLRVLSPPDDEPDQYAVEPL